MVTGNQNLQLRGKSSSQFSMDQNKYGVNNCEVGGLEKMETIRKECT